MANIKFSKKIFEKEIGRLDEKMQEKISMFGTPLEDITDNEIEIEVFPNRPDLLSYQGFKRAFLAYLGKEKGIKNYKVNKPEKNYVVEIDASVNKIRPYTACAIVKKLKLNDERIKEIIDLQEKLHITLGRNRKKCAIGIYPLEKIKLPITFKALEPDKIKFTPLEFSRELSGLEILQKHPVGKKYSHLLAGKSKFPIFIDSSNNILSMPPIINSDLTGKINEKTKNIFIECSGYDLEILKKCLNIIVTSLADMGGKIYQMNLSYGGYKNKIITPDLSSFKMKLSIENVNKLLGIKLNEKTIKSYLEKMGHNYNPKTKEVEISAWRNDVLHEIDLIEDIAIAHGYENFEPEIPKIATIGEENHEERIKKKISDILTGLGLLEVTNFYLTTKNNQFTKMGISLKNKKDFIGVKESKTEYSILRENLSHYLLKNLSENIDADYPQKIFEIGRTFEIRHKEITEKESLAIALAPGNFTEVKQILNYFSKMLDIVFEFREARYHLEHFIEGRIGEIFFNNKSIGFLGEIHPKILKNWKIKMPVALVEISISEIIENKK